MWWYNSVVEHLTADQKVPSSNLCAPSIPLNLNTILNMSDKVRGLYLVLYL